jgi:hypothetical protein
MGLRYHGVEEPGDGLAMGVDAVRDEVGMAHEEPEKDGQEHGDGFFDPAQVEDREQAHQRHGGNELEPQRPGREQAEDRVGAARHRDRDGQRVIDQARRPR